MNSATFNGDPLSAARSPQPRLSTLYARAFADDRDPLLLLRRPPENLHESTNMQSLEESHVNSSHELERSSYLSQAGWGSRSLESTHMDGTQMYGASRLLDASGFTDATVLGEPSKDAEIAALKAEIAALKRGVTLEDAKSVKARVASPPPRVANAVGQESYQNHSWQMLKQSVGLPYAKQEQPSVGGSAAGGSAAGAQQCASLSPEKARPLSPAQERPYAVPKGGVRFDAFTGQVAEGFNVGEVPLPGAAMTEDECRRFGLPLGSKWVNNEAVKNPISPLQDPNIHKIHWNELPVISAPIGVVKPGVSPGSHMGARGVPLLPFDSLQKPATDGRGTPPQKHVQNLEGADGEQLHRMVAQTLQRDLVSYQTQQKGLQEMEMRLREMYTSPHLPVESSASGTTSPKQIPKMSKQIPVDVPGRDPGQLQMVNGEAPSRWGNQMLQQDISMLASAYRGVLSPNLHPHTSTHLPNNRAQPQMYATPVLSSNQTSSNVGLQGMRNNMQGGGMNMGGGGGMGMFNPFQGNMQDGGMHGGMQHAADGGIAPQNGAAGSAPDKNMVKETEVSSTSRSKIDASGAQQEGREVATANGSAEQARSKIAAAQRAWSDHCERARKAELEKQTAHLLSQQLPMMHNQSLAGNGGFTASFGGFTASFDSQRGWIGASPPPMMGAAPHSVSLNMHAMVARGSPTPMAPAIPINSQTIVGGVNGFVGTGPAGLYRSVPGVGGLNIGLNMAPPMNVICPWWTTGGSGGEPAYRSESVYR